MSSAARRPAPRSAPARPAGRRRRLRAGAAALLAAAVLAGCVPPEAVEIPATRRPALEMALPAPRAFPGRIRPRGVAVSNRDLARDILDLTFRLESGREVPRLARFEGPISVWLDPSSPPTAGRDLDNLLARLRAEAGIDIARADSPEGASIRISFVPAGELRRSVPQAACFVVPRVGSWSEFRRARGSGRLDWTTLERRERAAVFIPRGLAPQEVRDCLHEEIAQSLGPVNDLFRLGRSVFNDDNIHSVLTPYDMVVLRALYDHELASGMDRAQVADRLPAILARINPAGRALPPRMLPEAAGEWRAAIGAALSPELPAGKRVAAARRAVAIARARGWHDNRLAFSLFALGRLSLGVERGTAPAAFAEARRVWADLYGEDDIHVAHADMQLAAQALSTGDAATALALAERALPVAREAENAALVSALGMIRAEALGILGRAEAARAARLDSLAWARYGFGDDAAARARLGEIMALAPQRGNAGG